MKKINFLLAAMLMAVATMTTSCLDADTSDNTLSTTAYATITGTNPNYVLYCDGGLIVKPTTSSVSSVTGAAGFGTNKRVFLSINYKESNLSQDTSTGISTITDGELTSGTYIPTIEILTKAQADAQNITAEDSTFAITSLGNAWAYDGYLTTYTTSYYAAGSDGTALYPSTNIVFGPEDVSENAITLHMYYNRHVSSKSEVMGSSTFLNSFDLSSLVDVIPGTGDITITLSYNNGETNTKTLICTRKMLTFQTF